MKTDQENQTKQETRVATMHAESGFALVAAIIILVILSIVSVTALTLSTVDTRITNNDLLKTQTFYAAEAKLEFMSYRYNNLFLNTLTPDPNVLEKIAKDDSSDQMKFLIEQKGFDFSGTEFREDTAKTTQYQQLFKTKYPFLRITEGPFTAMNAVVTPFIADVRAAHANSGTQVHLVRSFYSYLIPIFQFSLFSDKDVELDPGQLMTVSGRVHANDNVYAMRNLLFTGTITTAGELVRGVNRMGDENSQPGKDDVKILVRSPFSWCPNLGNPPAQVCKVQFNSMDGFFGSAVNGPNFQNTDPTRRGYYPGSPGGGPNGINDGNWDVVSLKPPRFNNFAAASFNGGYNKQVLTYSTGAIQKLKLPLGLDTLSPVELIKRPLPVDTEAIKRARYANKAQIRILVDDEGVTGNAAGIPAGKGVDLSSFNPQPLCDSADCHPLLRYDINGAPTARNMVPLQEQVQNDSNPVEAQTVRGVRSSACVPATNPSCSAYIPAGSGIRGHILIEVVDSAGNSHDVTEAILSMGMTVGEPNAIVMLQRPLWTAFMQGSFDRNSNSSGTTLFNIQRENVSQGWEVDGEIKPLQKSDFDNLGLGMIKTRLGLLNDTSTLNEDQTQSRPVRQAQPAGIPSAADLANINSAPVNFNAIVPINVYNVREGWINDSQNEFYVYKRGVTSAVDLNMYNLVRWLDGNYDANLLSGYSAAQAKNIGSDRGYVIYVSDRRGDKVKDEKAFDNTTLTTNNGDVDNEKVYWNAAAGNLPDRNPINVAGINPEKVLTDSILAGGKNNLLIGLQAEENAELPMFGLASTVVRSNDWDPDSIDVNTPGGLSFEKRLARAVKVMSWDNSQPSENYFRRSVRLDYGEKLSTKCADFNCDSALYGDKLSPVKGITVASENMVYIWGSYNTTGVKNIPDDGSTLNDGNPDGYQGPQVPASIICDAFFPLSKTWFDANSAMYPEGTSLGNTGFGETYYRVADDLIDNSGSVPRRSTAFADIDATAMRAAMLFGTTISTLRNNGGSARDLNGTISSGGMHNAPRFLEQWYLKSGPNNITHAWNFSGSMITLFNSRQAFAPWENQRAVTYRPPRRNWSFDNTFTEPSKLPPGTPFFQYLQSSAFQQNINQ